MGLDNYATGPGKEDLGPEDVAAFEREDAELCGGLMSGDAGSFRGKVYVSLVDAVTGMSLYEEWLSPEQTKRMYEALRDCDPDEFAEEIDDRFGDAATQIDNLRKFFKVCAERGLGLAGWW